MAAASEELTLTSHRTERRAWERARAEALLDASLTEAVLGISAANTSDRWRVDGVSHEIESNGTSLQIRVQDESGRYDLNSIDAGALMTLLRSADMDAGSASALANSILDWRSPAGPHRLNAASDDDYVRAHLPYQPRHAAFQQVDEVQLVLGMNREVFKKIRPALTVYNRHPGIDPALAPAASLLVLYNGDKDRVTTALAQRDQGDDASLPTYPSSHKGVLNSAVSLAGRIFDVEATAVIDGRLYRREQIVMIASRDPLSYISLWSS